MFQNGTIVERLNKLPRCVSKYTSFHVKQSLSKFIPVKAITLVIQAAAVASGSDCTRCVIVSECQTGYHVTL